MPWPLSSARLRRKRPFSAMNWALLADDSVLRSPGDQISGETSKAGQVRVLRREGRSICSCSARGRRDLQHEGVFLDRNAGGPARRRFGTWLSDCVDVTRFTTLVVLEESRTDRSRSAPGAVVMSHHLRRLPLPDTCARGDPGHRRQRHRQSCHSAPAATARATRSPPG